jgi:hypothetical protein
LIDDGLTLVVVALNGAPVARPPVIVDDVGSIEGSLGATVNWRASGHFWRLEVWMHDISSLWSRAEGKD